METSRRSFAALLGAFASMPLWDAAVAEVAVQGTVTAETVRALLDAQGGRGIFDHPDRFEELHAAVARTAANVAALRAFAVPDEVPPAIGFTRDQGPRG